MLLLAGCSILVAAAPADYPATVLANEPLAYYRLNTSTDRPNVNRNSGSLGAAGNSTNLNVHGVSGVIVGSRNGAAYFDSSARTIIPWNAALNPAATQDFTMEAWLLPTSDKVAGAFVGPSPIMNRYSGSVANRQGWVFFQRNPDASYSGDGQTDVGWNFRTYRGSGSSTGINVVSQVPYRLGQWQHVVAVWEAASQTATLFIDGQPAASQTWSGEGPGYVANTDDHGAESVNGPAGLAIGSYNNTEPGANPFRGAVDEVALYSKKLTAAQILAHYQNATNAARPTPYEVLVQADGPVGYWRLDDPVPGPSVAVNFGLVQNAGLATNTAEVKQDATGAVANDGAQSYHWRNGGATTDLPWLADNNPDASAPFTVEAWFRPTTDRQSPGGCPLNNRLSSGAANRTGWVFFQRAPNETYSGVSGFEGVGWDFRLYKGSGSGSSDVVSGVPYTVGDWQHVVGTWDGVGTAVIYVNGVATATNDAAVYTANSNPPLSPDDALVAADFAIGSYNRASGLGSNPFEGDVDEVAIYTNRLSADLVLAHYQAGTNAHPTTNYSTLVLTAGSDGVGTQALQPSTYLRFGDQPAFRAVNAGSLGDLADGSLVLTTNDAAGPRPPVLGGFEAGNLAAPLDGAKSWISLGNPAGLNVSGTITLEAWINPAATQGEVARIISHGAPTLSSYTSDQVATNGSVLAGSEVFLRLEGGTNYVVGSSDGTNTHGARAPALVGGQWIHLVGTYDGTHWNLYVNGEMAATVADTVGALPVGNAEWAIGATGNGWADSFAGSVDEVAIYDRALTAAQVKSHYDAGTGLIVEPPTLSLSRAANGDITISWSTGTLQASPVLPATNWQPVSGANPPSYTVTPAVGAATFYRVKQ